MYRPNKRYVVRLEAEERERLQGLVSVGKRAARKLTHARVLSLADQSDVGPGWTDGRIAEGLRVRTRSVERIRKRFVEEGLASALERKKRSRPSKERLLDGAKEAKLVAVCCSKPPEGRRRWTSRLLSDRLDRGEPGRGQRPVQRSRPEALFHDCAWINAGVRATAGACTTLRVRWKRRPHDPTKRP